MNSGRNGKTKPKAVNIKKAAAVSAYRLRRQSTATASPGAREGVLLKTATYSLGEPTRLPPAATAWKRSALVRRGGRGASLGPARFQFFYGARPILLQQA